MKPVSEMNDIKKILVRSTNWIGDAIMTTPAVARLATLFPNASITVAARPWVMPVFENNPSVSALIPLEAGRSPMKIMKNARTIEKGAFDMAVIFPNSFDAALNAWLARIPVRAGYATDMRRLLLNRAVGVPGWKGFRHEIFYYLNLVEQATNSPGPGAPCDERDTKGFLPPLVLEPGGRELGRCKERLAAWGISPGNLLVGFNPGAAFGPAKCWPEENFEKLGKMLLEARAAAPGKTRILVLGTERERETARRICGALGENALSLAGATTLSEAIALISMLDLLVTNDSGLMHVGAALDRPLVALFGSTNPVTTGPWSSRSMVVRNPVPCAPCLRRRCPSDFECMKGLAPETVLAACMKQLEKWGDA